MARYEVLLNTGYDDPKRNVIIEAEKYFVDSSDDILNFYRIEDNKSELVASFRHWISVERLSA